MMGPLQIITNINSNKFMHHNPFDCDACTNGQRVNNEIMVGHKINYHLLTFDRVQFYSVLLRKGVDIISSKVKWANTISRHYLYRYIAKYVHESMLHKSGMSSFT